MKYIKTYEQFINENKVNEGNTIKFKNKKVDYKSIEIDGVDSKDYPDFSDAYISYAEYTNGKKLSDNELDQFGEENGDLVHDLAIQSLI